MGVPLAKHGTYWRAQICSDACELCAPVRQRVVKTARARRDRDLTASHEGKRAQGRMS